MTAATCKLRPLACWDACGLLMPIMLVHVGHIADSVISAKSLCLLLQETSEGLLSDAESVCGECCTPYNMSFAQLECIYRLSMDQAEPAPSVLPGGRDGLATVHPPDDVFGLAQQQAPFLDHATPSRHPLSV